MSTYTDKESYEEKKEVQKTTYNKIGVFEIFTYLYTPTWINSFWN